MLPGTNSKCPEVFFTFLFIFISALLFSQTPTEPSRIILNPLESGHTGVSITWRCPREVKENYIQWKIADPHPIHSETILDQQNASFQLDTVTYEGKTGIFKSFRAQLTNLAPGTKYMYRVGSNSNQWSEWIQFHLPEASPDSIFSFIYFGDPQSDLHSQWSRTIRQAYSTAPESAFLLYAGDLVNRGYNDREWGDFYRAGDFIHRMIPSVMTPGNHEYEYPILSPLWKTHFTLPQNGPEEIKELYGACYYIDYPAVRIISLDGTRLENDRKLRKIQAKWLEKVLSVTDKKWIILTLHQPFYSTKASRDNPQIRKALKPLLDKYGVDLVLQGHDHAYGRGMLDENSKHPVKAGTMYVVSVSGPKMYEVGDQKEWMTKSTENTQLYQVIKINGNKLFFECYTTTGDLFDSFVLQKGTNASILIE